MLLHGDGTNGAQNNTFIDSSTNNFTITRTGNTTQGSFSPYGSNWSNYFGGTGNYLQIGNDLDLAAGTGSFTLEFWYNSTSTAEGRPTGNGTGGVYNAGKWALTSNYVNAGKLEFYVYNYAPSSAMFSSTSSTVASDGLWHHIVLVRSSNTWAMFIDGARQGSSITSAVSFNGSASAAAIGFDNISGDPGFIGYLSNYRFVIGTAVYDPSQTTLTVPTAPLTAISGTALLISNNNYFKPQSYNPNAYSFTIVGTPSVQRFNPFGTSTAYDTSVIGGSGYFDGSGDYLSTASNASLAIGSSDFCIEFWVYSNNANEITPFGQWVGSNLNWILQYRTGANQFRFYYNSSNDLSGNYTIVQNAWTHVVVCRSGSTMSLYVNGTRLATKTDSTSINNTTGLSVGRNADNLQYVTGFITDARIVVGSSVYTPSSSTLTVPTAPLTAITNTKFLANMTNGAIFDNAMMNDLETVGNAQISTSVVKFGTGSMAFDGTGDWLSLPSTQNLIFGRNFTIECWLYPSTLSGNQGIFASSGERFGLIREGNHIYWLGTPDVAGSSGTLTINTWHHIAVSRSGGTLRLFVNGVLGGSGATTEVNNLFPWYVGANQDLEAFNGYIDDLRITKNYARYTTTFTPPSAAFPNIGPI
jgi:hypothetical protein